MRIMTHAVRKAMMASSLDQHQESHQKRTPTSHQDEHDQNDQDSGAINIIPCQPTKKTKHHHHPLSNRNQNQNNVDDEVFDFITRENLPVEMEKYWAQRKRLFLRFDQGIRLDSESWYSVTPELIAQQIAARCRCKLIVDGFCGAGGNSIQFAMQCDKVIAIDKDPNKIKLAKHNSKIYGVSSKIEFICADFIEWIQDLDPGSVDIIFLSPPWGGIEYLRSTKQNEEEIETVQEEEEAGEDFYYKLKDLRPIDGKKLYDLAKRVTDRIVYYLPRHMDLIDLGRLEPTNLLSKKNIEVEENWMNQKCKALTIYFGPLVSSPSSK